MPESSPPGPPQAGNDVSQPCRPTAEKPSSTCSVFHAVASVVRFLSAQLILIAFGTACALAYYFPHVGAPRGTIHAEYSILYGAVGFIFLVSGLQVPHEKLKRHLKNGRLHTVVQGTSFVLIPVITIAIVYVMIAAGTLRTGAVDISTLAGMVVLSCIPTTIASNVVFTRNAGGDDAAAIVEVVIGNVVGGFLTPALIYAYLPGDAAFDPWRPASPSTLPAMYANVAKQLGLSVLLPLALGQTLRRLFADQVSWALRGLFLANFATICLALLVWTTFCNAFQSRALFLLPTASLVFNILMNLATYLLFTVVCFFLARPPRLFVNRIVACLESELLERLPAVIKRLLRPRRMGREEAIAVCFCGAAKTTSLGIPLVTAMWSNADDLTRAYIQIPVLMYTIEQVFVGQILVYFLRWYLRRAANSGGEGIDEETAGPIEGASAVPLPDSSESQGEEQRRPKIVEDASRQDGDDRQREGHTARGNNRP